MIGFVGNIILEGVSDLLMTDFCDRRFRKCLRRL